MKAFLNVRDLSLLLLVLLNIWQLYLRSYETETATNCVVMNASDQQLATLNNVEAKTSKDETTEQEKYYNKKYFDEQKGMGAFGGRAKQYQVRDSIRATDTVLDLGAGGGFFLHEMKCQQKIAVEINPFALDFMKQNFPEIKQYRFLKDVPDEIADVVTSMSVLEHIEAPVLVLRELYQKVKPNGLAILHVKNEGVLTDKKYNPNDWDQHLYTWNPSLFGNLVAAAGFKIEEVKAYQTAWPPNFEALWDQVGEKEFLRLAEIEGKKTNTWSIVLRARKVQKTTA